MSETRAKIARVCKLIFGYGIMITLFAGALVFLGFIVALIVGGDTATAMCTWIYKKFVPIMVQATSILILWGIASMYIAGEKALSQNKKEVKN